MVASLGVAFLSDCGEGKTPPGQEKRLLKAAAVTLRRIVGTKDSWATTIRVDQ
ncbi:hypothetical protein ACFVXA_17795 [Streptomyces sp. NPDC058246]|uniref:hypothetical protein n=1 Tax=Streptomyces sp. NPDC058246 TaxID=3346400 RepID=UPI0036E050D2